MFRSKLKMLVRIDCNVAVGNANRPRQRRLVLIENVVGGNANVLLLSSIFRWWLYPIDCDLG